MALASPVHPWSEFALAAPELAAFGAERFDDDHPSFLATVRDTHLPRVHPVSARVKAGHLALYMYPTSPKGKDLMLDGRYALHCSVADHQGGAGEFYVRGFGARVDDPDRQRELADAGFPAKEGYVVVELGVDEAFSSTYPAAAPDPVVVRWRRAAASDAR